jgi:hypothetical protein
MPTARTCWHILWFLRLLISAPYLSGADEWLAGHCRGRDSKLTGGSTESRGWGQSSGPFLILPADDAVSSVLQFCLYIKFHKIGSHNSFHETAEKSQATRSIEAKNINHLLLSTIKKFFLA